MSSAAQRTFAYDAFMSYSHASDRALAPVLQKLIRRVGRPWYARGRLRIFRDQTNLPMSEGLWSAIESALADSRCFVLMASPRAAQSPWVQREVAYWRAHRPRSDFFIVQTDGRITWDGTAGDFDWDLTDALPRSPISGWFEAEPRWLDVRPSGTPVRSNQRNDRLRDAARTIAARLYSVDKDQLEGEDEQESRRARRTLMGGVAALVLLTVVALVAALLAVDNAAEARAQLRTATARALAAESDNLAARDPVLSTRLALAAAKLDPVPQTTAAVMRSMERNRHVRGYLEQSRDFRDPGDIGVPDDAAGYVEISPSGRLVAVADSFGGEIRLWDAGSQQLLARLPSDHGGDGSVAPRLRFGGDGRLVAVFAGQIDVWDLETYEKVRAVPLDDLSVVAVAPDGKQVALYRRDPASGEGSGYQLDLSTRNARPELIASGPGSEAAAIAAATGHPAVESMYPELSPNFSDVSADGSTAVVLPDFGTIELWDLRAQTLIARRPIPGGPGWIAIGISDDGSSAIVGNDVGELLRFSAALSLVEPVMQLPFAINHIDLGPGAGDLGAVVDDVGNTVLLAPLADARFDRLVAAAGGVDSEGRTEQPRLAASDDGRWLAVQRTASVQLWNIAERRLYGEFAAGDLPAEPTAAFSADSTRFAVVGAGSVEVRELPSLAVVAVDAVADDPLHRARALQKHLGGIRIISTRDATTSAVLAVGSGGERVLAAIPVNAFDRSIDVTIGASTVAVAWTTDALASGPDRMLSTWDLRGDAPTEVANAIVPEFSEPQFVSADGRSVALSDGVLDMTSGRILPLAGGDGQFSDLSGVLTHRDELLVRHIGPTRTATAGIRNTLLVWDARLGLLLGQWQDPLAMRSPGAQSTQVIRVGDGKVATVRPDGSVAVWTVAPEEWSARLCALVGDLAPAERAVYLTGVDTDPACSG